MNQLSWLIYLADASQGIGVLASITFLLTGVALGGYIFYNALENDRFKVHNGLLATAVAAGLISALIPSKNTVYAIAASEMGEAALNTPVVNKATRALEAWLDKQIADANEDSDK